LAEVFAETVADGAATGFVLAQPRPAARSRSWSRDGAKDRPRGPMLFWVQDRLSRREAGRPYATGIAALLGAPVEMLCLEVSRPADVLWAMEQALGCAALSAVVGEVWGDPAALDFTATKRLALRAEREGVQAWLIRRAATPALSAARERWRVGSVASVPRPEDRRAPGAPLWRAVLFRSRTRAPGDWMAGPDGVAHDLARDLAQDLAPARRGAALPRTAA